MNCCVLFGGAGFVGTHLAKRFLRTGRFDCVHIADIRPTELEGTPGITSSVTDVRDSIPVDLMEHTPEWIFNLAAIHREPGHTREEYYDTNLKGAHNVRAYAEATGCRNIYFTSSISVYGPTTGPTDESSPIQPSTPYGGSKYPAELIHHAWQQSGENRRLLISRPGVLYGPGDPGNILRMIRAIRKGYFAFPGSPLIYKSYGYIYGLMDSIEFTMDSNLDVFTYNYVETPTQPLGELVDVIKGFLGTKAVVLPIPLWMLMPAARLVQTVFGSRNPIHPVRVKKAATPTHIVPRALIDKGFHFAYDFERTLRHWSTISPEDFGMAAADAAEATRSGLKLMRPAETGENAVAAEAPAAVRSEQREGVAV